MGHDLNEVNGKVAMMYNKQGGAPWHTLGTALDGPATAEEAIVTAGLDWTIDLVPLQTTEGAGIDFAKAVKRSDTGDIFDIVGVDWRPIQNHQAFGFLDAVAGEGKVRYETAGALGRGERVWMLARLEGLIRVGRTDDTVNKYLLFSNTHKANFSAKAFFTPIRVVCQNTLTAALGRAAIDKGITIRHTGQIESKVNEAQRVLGLAVRYYDDLGPVINRLAAHRPGVKQVESYFKAMYPDPVDPVASPRAAKNAEEKRGMLHQLFEGGLGQDMPGIKGSTWALYNAVTEAVDYRRGSPRGRSEVGASKHLESMWFGTGQAIKAKAWECALDIAGVSLDAVGAGAN